MRHFKDLYLFNNKKDITGTNTDICTLFVKAVGEWKENKSRSTLQRVAGASLRGRSCEYTTLRRGHLERTLGISIKHSASHSTILRTLRPQHHNTLIYIQVRRQEKVQGPCQMCSYPCLPLNRYRRVLRPAGFFKSCQPVSGECKGKAKNKLQSKCFQC